MKAPVSRVDRSTALVQKLQRAIRAEFPEAEFDVRTNAEGRIYLSAYTTATNDFDVQDLVVELTVDALLKHDLKIHVFPRRLGERVATRP
jgi:hypothetical protein